MIKHRKAFFLTLLLSIPLWCSQVAIAADQCNTTAQCQSAYSSSATDCKNSRSANSVCMCGSIRCDGGSASSNNTNDSNSGGSTLYSENFDNKKSSPWGDSDFKHGNYGKNGKGLKMKYVRKRDGSKFGSNAAGGAKTFGRTSAATLLYDIKLADDWDTTIGGKFHGLGPKNPVSGCKPLNDKTWSARIVINDRVPFLYLYYQGKSEACGHRTSISTKKLEKNKWYRVALYVKLNDKNKNNAVARLYIDGKKVAEKKNFKFHNSSSRSDVDIQQFIVSTFLGVPLTTGIKLGDHHAHFDNVRVYKDLEVKR